MDSVARLIACTHNHRIIEDIEEKLNKLIEAINEAGGECWIKCKSNKEHYYTLTEPVGIEFYLPFDTNKEEETR